MGAISAAADAGGTRPAAAGSGPAGSGLGASERQRRLLLEHSLAPICVHDGRDIVYINWAAVRGLGAASSDEIRGRPIADFVHPESRAALSAQTGALHGDGDMSVPIPLRLVRVDGTDISGVAVISLTIWRDRPLYQVLFREHGTRRIADPRQVVRAGHAVIMLAPDHTVTGWNIGAELLYGRPAAGVLGRPITAAIDAPLDVALLAEAGVTDRATHYDCTKAAVPVRVSVTDIGSGFVVVCSDDTAQRRRSELYRRFRAVLDGLDEGVIIIGSNGQYEFINVAAQRILGASPEQLIDLHPSDRATGLPLYATDGSRLGSETRPLDWIRQAGLELGGQVVGIDRADGRRIWITGHGCLLEPDDSDTSSVLFSFSDVTAHYDAERRLLHEATHDSLTGLPVRRVALDRAGAALTAPAEAGRLAAVLFIDLDNLKAINDSHGHRVGDEVLRSAASRMRNAARAGDVIARYGGDEFIALVFEPAGRDELDAFAERLHADLSTALRLGPLSLHTGVSIGITTVGPDDPRGAAELIRDADLAMYAAKSAGRGHTRYFSAE
jgi:diguanylate cyclase (GGDEF)-like protein/PAS domain S-box-containing protein